MHVENLNLQALRELVENHPLRQIRGRFRTDVPFDQWEFFYEEDEYEEREKLFDDYLLKEKHYVVLLTEDNVLLGKFEITTSKMFDDGVPDNDDTFFLVPERLNNEVEPGEELQIILRTDSVESEYGEFGKFSAQLELPRFNI